MLRHNSGEKSDESCKFNSEWHHCITFTQNEDSQESICICSCWRSSLNSAFPWQIHSHEVMRESLAHSLAHFSHCKTLFTSLIPTGFVAVMGSVNHYFTTALAEKSGLSFSLCVPCLLLHTGRTETWRKQGVQLLGGGFAVVPKYPLAALVGSGCICKHSQALSFGLFLGARFSFDGKQDVCVN